MTPVNCWCALRVARGARCASHAMSGKGGDAYKRPQASAKAADENESC